MKLISTLALLGVTAALVACNDKEPAKPAETAPAQEAAKPAEAAPAQEAAKPAEAAPAQEAAKPVETAPAQEAAKPAEAAPAQEAAKPAETAPAQEAAKPAEAAPVMTVRAVEYACGENGKDPVIVVYQFANQRAVAAAINHKGQPVSQLPFIRNSDEDSARFISGDKFVWVADNLTLDTVASTSGNMLYKQGTEADEIIVKYCATPKLMQ